MAIIHNQGHESTISSDGLITVEGLWYNKKSIQLDGYRFVRCRFDTCHISVTSPRFELIDCFIDNSSLKYFSNDIMKIIKLFNSGNEVMYDRWPDFAPKRNADGTISITGM